MFRIPRVNIVDCDEGFSIEVGMTRILYTEGPKKLYMDCEMQASPGTFVIYKKTIRKWEPPYSDELIDEKEREEIIENVRRAFRFRGEWINVL